MAIESVAKSKILSLLQSLELSIVSGDEQNIKTGGKQHGDLIVRVTSRLEGESMPAAGIPVRFDWESRTVKKTESVLTDPSGEARLTLDLQRSTPLPAGTHAVTASVDKESLFASAGINPGEGDDNASEAIVQLRLSSVKFNLRVAPQHRSTRVLLLIEESNMGRLSDESIVMQTLSEALHQAGFLVVAEHEIGRTNTERLNEAIRKNRTWPLLPEMAHEADIAIIGTATTQKGSDNMGIVISSHADLFVRAINLKSGAVVAQKNVLSLAGFGDTPELAGIKALSEAGGLAAESIVNQLTALEEETDVKR